MFYQGVLSMQQIRMNLEKHMRKLCLDIGSRHCGSAGEAAAAEYLYDVFKSYGYDPVFEKYKTRGWEFKSFYLYNVTENRPVPDSLACFFSNAVDIEGKLFWLTTADVSHLEDFDVENKICMVECWSGMQNVSGRNHIAEILDSKGAAAAIFISNIHTSFAPSSKIERSPHLKKLGVCAVSQNGAFDLARHKNDTYRIKIDARCFDHESCNVVASRPGRGGVGVFGAHYDTAPLTQGAGDNATGTAIVLELARLLKEEPSGMKLDFVEFSAEEYIPEFLPPGSEDYIRRRKSGDIKWLMNYDDFGLLIGEPVIKVGLKDKLPKFSSQRYPVFEASSYDGDDKSFCNNGVPSIWYYDRNPFSVLHTSCDSLDTVDLDKMTNGVIDSLDVFKQLAGVK